MMDVEYDGFYDRNCIYTPQNMYIKDILTMKAWGWDKTNNKSIHKSHYCYIPALFPLFCVIFICIIPVSLPVFA